MEDHLDTACMARYGAWECGPKRPYSHDRLSLAIAVRILAAPSHLSRLVLSGVVPSPAAGHGQKVQKVMVQPINLIFRYLQNRSRIQVWLYEQVDMRLEGCIIGFDEYMNLVLDDAEEIHSKTKSRKQLGQIMLKGDDITLLQSVSN
ncbi:small nuclear ribonucleoprotein E-like [Podarcis raffonei]|uniref:small nuclear ribonucleoprotein E-like n=1 Tax=Podarcis raffonei TaxID=65483 RepID=UPI0023293178|nr:small nuclear ribonucleoprotein E-like [Podarcis raffonei]